MCVQRLGLSEKEDENVTLSTGLYISLDPEVIEGEYPADWVKHLPLGWQIVRVMTREEWTMEWLQLYHKFPLRDVSPALPSVSPEFLSLPSLLLLLLLDCSRFGPICVGLEQPMFTCRLVVKVSCKLCPKSTG